MDIKKAQKHVRGYFKELFGSTPLNQRLADIRKEAEELSRFTDIGSLRCEFGDLLASVLAGIDECGFDAHDLLDENECKVRNRAAQYRSLGRKTQVAILGGAFNPVTNGHIGIAKYVLKVSRIFDEVWLCPCYGHMYGKDLESTEHRLAMLEKATKSPWLGDPRIKVFDYEIKHKLSGETYHFVKRLLDDELSETHNFSMIIGMDNANTFDQWVNFQELERLIRFVVVPRIGQIPDPNVRWYLNSPHIYLPPDLNDVGNGKHKSHLIEVSSSQVRQMIADKIDEWSRFVDPFVADYIRHNNLYNCTVTPEVGLP